ncbi:MAG: Gfo/Idh/MocA family oxidoreductase [Candidatus Hydrogenedentes bacterium]|nr:Gfo/Idh/MocA family oxidoreductase [Candidatus Hydrogenedentota bacterium]
MALGPGKPRVAIVGASGIGKHHAKWWDLEGADVCAFAGTSDARIAQTGNTLRELFGFNGRGYRDIDAMLREERPDIVDICSPPHLHAGHCARALDAGAHVLCEKPFVYDPAVPTDKVLEQAAILAHRADRLGLRLGVCTQYSAGARTFRDLWRRESGSGPLRKFRGQLETPARGQTPDPIETWIDLASHPISMLLEVAPGCRIDWSSLDVAFEGRTACARFRADVPDGGRVDCELVTRNTDSEHLRMCHLNDWEVRVEGCRGADGVYRAKLVTQHGQTETDDFMHALIREFRNETVLPDLGVSLVNLTITLRILQFAVERPVKG